MLLALLLTSSSALRPLMNGGDLSFIPEYRSLKTTFYDGMKERDPLESFASRGAKLLRLRVWVNPPAGFCSTERTLELAREAKRLGMQTLIDFHYSDDWADPQHQIPPAAWKEFDQTKMETAVFDHTKDVVQRLAAQGTPGDMVQIGNEIRDGMIWPMGQISKSGYAPLSKLLIAGVDGVRAGAGKRVPRIMIHHDRGAELAKCKPFYQELLKRGVKFDVIGISYYPWWHGTLDGLKENMNGLAETFKKPVMIVETAYPFTLGWKDQTGNFVGEEKQLVPGFPATPHGQAKFLRELNRLVRAVPKDRGLGVVYWAPEYVAQPGISSPYENLALYDFEHRILPGADALGDRPVSPGK